MKIWEPKTLCLCASLRTGTLVLGWIGVIGSTLPLLFLLGFANISREGLIQSCASHSAQINMAPESCANLIQGMFAFYGTVESITLIMSILLLVGVDQDSPSLMLPYLVGRGIYVAILIILGLVSFIGLAHKGLVWATVYSLILFGGISFLSVYFFLVVRTYYKEVKQRDQPMESNSSIPYVEQVNLN